MLEQLVYQTESRFGAIKEDGDLHFVGHVAQQLLGARRKLMLEILRPDMPLIMLMRVVIQRYSQRDDRQRGAQQIDPTAPAAACRKAWCGLIHFHRRLSTDLRVKNRNAAVSDR